MALWRIRPDQTGVSELSWLIGPVGVVEPPAVVGLGFVDGKCIDC